MVLAIMTGATLSFLGLGPQPPTPEWGAMFAEGRQFLLRAWWIQDYQGNLLQTAQSPDDGALLLLVTSPAINRNDPLLAVGA